LYADAKLEKLTNSKLHQQRIAKSLRILQVCTRFRYKISEAKQQVAVFDAASSV